MAALVLRRASSCPLIPLATRSFRSSSLIPLANRSVASCSSVSHHLPFSTSSAIDHGSHLESIVGKSVPFSPFQTEPLLPIPDGFPFTITNYNDLVLTRQDEDETFKVEVNLKSYRLVHGNPCYGMRVSIHRGDWELTLIILAGPKTLIIEYASMSASKRPLRSFEEFLNSKGINEGMVTSLLGLIGKQYRKNSLLK